MKELTRVTKPEDVGATWEVHTIADGLFFTLKLEKFSRGSLYRQIFIGQPE